ncbi:hypothetical protein BJV74DRAFT_853644 [Russula compacta]|nr:hypothetical protein BJV74DRAFT_853644 [Russula compacta]
MSEDPIGICCSIAFVACLEICTGICLDFASIRHSCTETMCKCRACGCGRSHKALHLPDEERAPLIQQAQPAPTNPMMPDGR